jgi:hypothetical protein
MTTAKLYQKLRAGEISKQKFLYEVRRDLNLPWVTNVTSYEDAVKILKNKGIISEGATMPPMHHGQGTPDHEGAAYDYNAEVNEDEYNDEWTNKRVMYKGKTATVFGAADGKLDLQFDDVKKTTISNVPEEEVKIIEELNEAHDLTTLQIIDRLNPYAFKRAVEYEMKKLKVLDDISYEKVKEKVAKKMAKDPLAYRYTQLTNAKQVEKDDNRLSMTPVKGNNFVDKANEMKRIKGHADEKKNTSTPKTENRKGKPKGVKEMKGSKKKPAEVKDVMKHETKETVLNEMAAFFKKKDRLKENDGTVSGLVPQERTDFYPGHECWTPDGAGNVIERKGSIVTVKLEDGSQKDYTLNVLDAAKEKQAQDQMAKDKAERDQMWSNWDKQGHKTFGGELPYAPEDIHSLLKKLKNITEKLKMKKEGEALKDKAGNVTYASDAEAPSIVQNAAKKGIKLTRQKV